MENIQSHLLELPEHLSDKSWKERIEYLFQNQIATWPMACNHYRQFESIERRTLMFDGFRFEIQHNPARARSTCAKVDKIDIENRKCFLCSDNLPEEQKGLVIRNQYLLMVNPFPIFNRHFTIPEFEHTPQRISGRILDMLAIAKELSGYTVFYNGPRCGASAPDHFHFQAVEFGVMPIDKELEILKVSEGKKLIFEESIQITVIEKCLRYVIVMESEYPEPIDYFFEQMKEKLPLDEESGEPMMNILASYIGGRYRLTVFPRKKQRPSCYYREGNDRILVSPASVEFGGVIVTPNEDNFKNISKEDLIEIFNEVSMDCSIDLF